jgi:ATP synthase mitochondrial F1 complex assembly factor 1
VKRLCGVLKLKLNKSLIVENPYFDKYAEKLAKVQKTSPEEFVARLEKQKEIAKEAEPKSRNYSELMNPKKGDGKGEIPHKKLEDIMKLDLIQGKPVDEITKIWLEYHKQKEVLAAVIPNAIFNTLMENSKKYPLFIFPIPRSQGYEFFVFQFAANTVHFTPLLVYQVSRWTSLSSRLKLYPNVFTGS